MTGKQTSQDATDKAPEAATDPQPKRAKSFRHIRLTPEEIEDIIAAGQRRGLTTTSVVHFPDGRCEVRFGGEDSPCATNSSWRF